MLRSLPGEPRLVICDDSAAVQNAVAKVWPNAFVRLCEHHLRAGAIKSMRPYGLTSYGRPTVALLNGAFRSPAGWKAFQGSVKGIGIDRWIQSYDQAITDQTERLAALPDHHSTGALDEALAKVREFMEPRAFCYRNAERTSRMLEPVRLRLDRADDPTADAAAIRAHLDANGGRLGRQGAIRDTRGRYSLR